MRICHAVGERRSGGFSGVSRVSFACFLEKTFRLLFVAPRGGCKCQVLQRVHKHKGVQLHPLDQSQQNFKCVIVDAQSLFSQIVTHAPLSTCMLGHARGSIVPLALQGGPALHVHVFVMQCTVFNIELTVRG